MAQDNKTATPHNLRKLEDLNLIDNFLFQEMLAQEEGEEFARILLSTILDKPIRNVKIIPQKAVQGRDTDKHGIRMDAFIQEIPDELVPNTADADILPNYYDMEPNKIYEKEQLPKRVRYYHGLVDTQLLSAGSDYEKLPNVVIIMILPYDPFDRNRMVYTVQNQCVEDHTLPYDDGARKIFLYTKGKEGNPSQKLRDMLKYIEESTDENVTNQDIASIQQLVNRVKRKKEVGINYMKSWEMERYVRREAFQEGFDDGFNDGTERINKLNTLLIEDGRMEDLVKAAKDKEYQKALLEEFQL